MINTQWTDSTTYDDLSWTITSKQKRFSILSVARRVHDTRVNVSVVNCTTTRTQRHSINNHRNTT